MSYHIVNTLEGFLGDHATHNEDKGQITFDCPACADEKGLINGDGKGRLSINYKRGIFKCWRCAFHNNMHGSIEKLIRRYGTPLALKDYKLHKEVYADYQQELDYNFDREIHINLPKDFIAFKTAQGDEDKFYAAKKYLTERRITDKIIEKFNIGFANRGYYRNRIIIPSYDATGQVNYFTARTFAPWGKPKYLNPDEDRTLIIFNEGKINWDVPIVLLEGPTDHIVVPNSIPTLGKELYPKLSYTLQNKAKAGVIIMLDPDAWEEAEKMYKELDYGNLRGQVKLCYPPDDYDPSKIYELLGKKGIIQLLKGAKHLETF